MVLRGALCFEALSRSSLRVLALCATVALATSGCGIIRKKPDTRPDEFDLVGKPIPPEEAGWVLNELGNNFAYGPGIGETALNIGTSVLFPPYALVLVGNAVLSLSGYEPVGVSSFLPEDAGDAWSGGYDEVVSAPGRVVAAVAGKEFRSRKVAREKLRHVLDLIEKEQAQADTNTATQAFAEGHAGQKRVQASSR
jgi:hypothetical protein